MASPPYWIWTLGIFLIFSFLPLYFPNGRLVSRRWRPLAWLAAFITVILTVFSAVQPGDGETPGIPNPLSTEGLRGLPNFAEVFDVAAPALWMSVGVLSAASLVVRFRRSRGEERQQIKWVVYAVVLLTSYTLLDQFILQERLSFAVNLIFFMVFFEGPWVAIAIAILRYRLYDVDLVINRTLVYGSLTAMLVTVYFGDAALAEAIFRALRTFITG
jgi:hypothetical protein